MAMDFGRWSTAALLRANGRMAMSTETDSITMHRSDAYAWAGGRQELETATRSTNGKTGHCSKECIRKAAAMGSVRSYLLTEVTTKENSKTIVCLVPVGSD